MTTRTITDDYVSKQWKAGDNLFASDMNDISATLNRVQDEVVQLSGVIIPEISEKLTAIEQKQQSIDVPEGQTVKQYVDASIAQLVGSAPQTIDTIEQVAAAIQQNQSVITTIDQMVTANKTSIGQTNTKVDTLTSRVDQIETSIPDHSQFVTRQQYDAQKQTFANVDEVNASLQGKQDKGDYALKSDLTPYATIEFVNGELENKQAAGNYATVDQIPDVSGFATTEAMNAALQGKQDVGDYALKSEIPDVSDFVDNATVDQLVNRVATVEQTSGSIFAIQSKLDQLAAQMQSIKTPDITAVEVSQEAAEVNQPDTNVSFNAQTVSGIIGKIEAKSITSTDASIQSGRLIANATEDVSVNKFTTTGNLEKSVANAGLTVNSGQYVNITSGDWKQTGYNGIEVGLESAPKSVLIDGIDFSVPMTNNAITIFNWKPNAVITISNCHFADVSNPIRISNRDGANATVNIVNCTCDKWDVNQPQYAGMICFQDYTSKSAQDAVSSNQFGKDKLTVNLVNCYGPGNVRIEGDAKQLTDNHVIYVYNEHEGLLEFDENRFPLINAR